jgi:uncharacterized protein YndB with AHSA1/START domain
MNQNKGVTVVIRKAFAAPAERVFDAWLDPRLVAQWMFSPKLLQQKVVHIQLDPQVGGSFSFLVDRGGQQIDHVGRYVEVERPTRLVFTWAVKGPAMDESQVTVDIAATDSGRELTLTHELHPAWADYTDRVEASWTKMLGALANVFGEKDA